MVNIERKEYILKQLEKKHTVKVNELSKDLFIGEATIRRDLCKLEKEGYLKRIYGGAVYLNKIDREIPADVRFYENASKKLTIATLAAKLLHDDMTISIDSSTTCLFLAEHLKKHQSLTVFTHGQLLLSQLQYSNLNLYSSGGLLSKHTSSYGGEFTRHFFSSFFTDICFLSCKGLSATHGITYAYDEEAAIRKIMLHNSRKRVLLCDSSKFDKISTSCFLDLEMIDYLITDSIPNDPLLTHLRNKGILILTPDSSLFAASK